MEHNEQKRHCDIQKPSMLINEISKLFRNRMRENSEKLGFKNGYRQILMFLSHGDGVTQLDLANASHFKAPTISVTLKKMEEEGLVLRKTDPMDSRKTRVYLTEEGRALDDRFHDKIIEFENVMLNGIHAEEEAALLSSLRRIRDNILSSNENQ